MGDTIYIPARVANLIDVTRGCTSPIAIHAATIDSSDAAIRRAARPEMAIDPATFTARERTACDLAIIESAFDTSNAVAAPGVFGACIGDIRNMRAGR